RDGVADRHQLDALLLREPVEHERLRRALQKCGEAGSPASPRGAHAAADLGRRPRRAAAWPGILPAHESQRSACLAPRRASEYVTRNVAPLPSSTSFPQLSQTSTVLRANEILLERGVDATGA